MKTLYISFSNAQFVIDYYELVNFIAHWFEERKQKCVEGTAAWDDFSADFEEYRHADVDSRLEWIQENFNWSEIRHLAKMIDTTTERQLDIEWKNGTSSMFYDDVKNPMNLMLGDEVKHQDGRIATVYAIGFSYVFVTNENMAFEEWKNVDITIHKRSVKFLVYEDTTIDGKLKKAEKVIEELTDILSKVNVALNDAKHTELAYSPAFGNVFYASNLIESVELVLEKFRNPFNQNTETLKE